MHKSTTDKYTIPVTHIPDCTSFSSMKEKGSSVTSNQIQTTPQLKQNSHNNQQLALT